MRTAGPISLFLVALGACSPGAGEASLTDAERADAASPPESDAGSPDPAEDAGASPDAAGPTTDDADVRGDAGSPDAAAPAPRVIDVFVAAGPGETFGAQPPGADCSTSACGGGRACDRSLSPPRCVVPPDAWRRGCHADTVSSCSLYRLAVDLDTGAVESVSLALDPRVHLEPGSTSAAFMFPRVSPGGDRIALEVRRVATQTGEIRVCDLSSLECATVSGAAPEGLGRWPSWLGPDELLFAQQRSGMGAAWADVFVVGLRAGATEVERAASTLLGAAGTPAGADTSRFAFEDPHGFVRGGARMVATHGNWPAAPACRDARGLIPSSRSDCVFFPSSVPAVWNIDAGVGLAVSLDMTEIESPWACAHVAVSPDGERLLCTVQETYADPANVAPSDVYGDPYTTPIDSDGDGAEDARVKQYVTFEMTLDEASSRYVSSTGREMFRHLGPAALHAIEPRFEPGACASPTHAAWLHKYTEYCGDSQHVVTTVFCVGPTALGDGSPELPNRVVHSAVYLVDLTDREAPRYTNVTTPIESWLGGEALTGAFATCAALR